MAFTPPVSATVNYDTIVSQTLNNTKAERYDAIFRHSAVFAWLNLAGRKEFVDGGIQIQRDVEYATNGTVAAYEGYDAIDLTPQETDTSLLDSLKEVAGSVVISRREERQNSGAPQIINLLQSKIENLDRSFGQKLNEFMLSTSVGSKEPNSIPSLITFDGTGTVHGISTTGNSWWQNKSQASGSIDAQTLTATEFKQEFRNFYNDCNKHDGGRVDMILTGQEVEEKWEEVLEAQVRYGDTRMADLGFETVKMRNANIVWDEICPRIANNGSAFVAHDDGTADEFPAFFINSDFLKLCIDSQTDLVNRPFMDSIDQTAKSALVLWMGQLICTNRRTQGVLTNIQPSNIN